MGCASSKTKEQAEEAAPKAAPAPSAQQTSEAAGSSAQPRKPALEAPRASGLRETAEKPLVIFVIGGPGSGKGTQCSKIVEKYDGGCRHLSTGDLLRAEVERGTDLGKELAAKMKSGALVSDEQVIALLEKEISASAWFGLAFLVDGFPRTVPQAEQFDAAVRPCDAVLYFECPEKEMLQRLRERGKSSGRADDAPATIKERVKTFRKQSLPVVRFYEGQGKLHTISAVPPPDEVFKEVAAILDRTFKLEVVVPPATEDASDWRPKQVVDIENRFYGARD